MNATLPLLTLLFATLPLFTVQAQQPSPAPTETLRYSTRFELQKPVNGPVALGTQLLATTAKGGTVGAVPRLVLGCAGGHKDARCPRFSFSIQA